MIISQCEFAELLAKLDNASKISSWEKANVIATFCAVIVALFFPLREYIRTLFPKFALKVNVPEIREAKLDGIKKPHISVSIKNLSKEVLYLKDAYLYFKLKDYRVFLIHLHLGLENEVKILPYSEEFVEYLIWHKNAYSGRNPINEFLSTNKQVAKQYLEGVTGFEKVKDISMCIRTNLGRSCRRIPKWGWDELIDQLFYIVDSLDKEQQIIQKKYLGKNQKGNINENFVKYLKEINELNGKRYTEYEDKCKRCKQEEKERKKRRKEILKKNRVSILKRIFHLIIKDL